MIFIQCANANCLIIKKYVTILVAPILDIMKIIFIFFLYYCLGMGRNSSRIASRRIASNSREPTSYAGLLSDDEDDADWAGGSLQNERRKRRIKNNNRKPNKLHKYVAVNLP